VRRALSGRALARRSATARCRADDLPNCSSARIPSELLRCGLNSVAQGTDRLAYAFYLERRTLWAPTLGAGARSFENLYLHSGARERPMGWWIIVSGLTFILAAILACGSVLPTSELVRAALDVVAILSGMVCVGLGEGV
jgi:hypothetical protein